MATMKLSLIFIGFLSLFSTINGQGIGALRLIRNNTYSRNQAFSSGIVEIYYNGGWGNICDYSPFGSNEANVICHQLSFIGASTYGNAGSTTIYGEDPAQSLLEDIYCPSRSYLVLLQCYYKSQHSSYCNKDIHDAFVVCYSAKIWNSSPYSGQLRLLNGTYSNQGRLEIFCNGYWGTVCRNSFGANDANVACKQLGYSGYFRYNYESVYAGSTYLPIWLDYVHCSNSETCLVNCESCPSFQYTNCNHSKDVSLECEFTLSPANGPHVTLSTCNKANSGSGNDAFIYGLTITMGVIFFIAAFVFCCCCLVCCSKNDSTTERRKLVLKGVYIFD